MPPWPQTRTKGDEGHRMGLGTTHSGHQDVVAQQGLDQQAEPQEELIETESICDTRHPQDISLSTWSTMANGFSRDDSLLFTRRGRISRSILQQTIVSLSDIIFFSFSSFFLFFFITNDLRHVRTRPAFVTNFFRASAKRETACRNRGEFVFFSERFRSGKRNDTGGNTDLLRSNSRWRIDGSSSVQSCCRSPRASVSRLIDA